MTLTKMPIHVPSDLNRLARETGMLLATVDSLSAEELTESSRCEGWTRAHVVAHLARNADALVRLIEWATSGTETSAYASPEERDEDVEKTAGLPPAQLKAELHEACARFSEAAPKLRGDLAAPEVKIGSNMIEAVSIVARRTTEVIIHHHDLDTVWELEEADPDSLLDALEIGVERLENRDDVPGFELVTEEADEWTVGGGGPKIEAARPEALEWIARGVTEGLRPEGDVPDLPAWG